MAEKYAPQYQPLNTWANYEKKYVLPTRGEALVDKYGLPIRGRNMVSEYVLPTRGRSMADKLAPLRHTPKLWRIHMVYQSAGDFLQIDTYALPTRG